MFTFVSLVAEIRSAHKKTHIYNYSVMYYNEDFESFMTIEPPDRFSRGKLISTIAFRKPETAPKYSVLYSHYSQW